MSGVAGVPVKLKREEGEREQRKHDEVNTASGKNQKFNR